MDKTYKRYYAIKGATDDVEEGALLVGEKALDIVKARL